MSTKTSASYHGRWAFHTCSSSHSAETYINHIDGGVDLGHLLRGKGDHVPLEPRDGDGQLLIADGRLYLLEEQGVVGDLIRLARVGVLLIVLAVSAGVLPVDV